MVCYEVLDRRTEPVHHCGLTMVLIAPRTYRGVLVSAAVRIVMDIRRPARQSRLDRKLRPLYTPGGGTQ
jgi:hypothetical protein